jgi:ankyrin repeat protein
MADESRPTEATSPLHQAAAGGDHATVRRLLVSGADAAVRTPDGLSPLGLAIEGGHTAVTRLLVESGVDPNAPARQDMPALVLAALRGRDDVIPFLVSAGAALEYAHPVVGSALSAAVIGKHAATVERLLEAGARVDLRNEGGATALHFAAFTGQLGVVERLLSGRGIDVDDMTFTGGTPLRAAAANGHADLVKRLLALGADAAPVDDFDRRPADDARDGGHAEVVALLEAASPATRSAPARVRRNPFALMLPPREDATLKAVVHGWRRGQPVAEAGASAIEAPSMLSVCRMLSPKFVFSCQVDRGPDPRAPARRVKTRLWTYARLLGLADQGRATVPPPDEAVAARVASVAAHPYLLRIWSQAALRAARGMARDALPRVLATMAHGVDGPGYVEIWDWRFRVQVAAALVVSYLGDEPWDGAARRQALEDVAEGPADWTSTAAIIALMDVARRDEAARPAVVAALHRCARRPFNPTLWQHVVGPASRALHDLGAIEADEAKALEASQA